MNISYCPFCGCKVDKDEDSPCPKCGSTFPRNNIQLKVPSVAAILSAFFPGLGQIYNGDKLAKGLLIFFAFFVGSLFYFIPGIIIWIYGIYEAYNRARMIQNGEIEYTPANKKDILLLVLIPLVFMLIALAITILSVYSIYGSPEHMLNNIHY